MPTLYAHKDANIRKTWAYLTGFLLFVIAVGWMLNALTGSSSFLWIAVAMSVLMSAGSYWYSDKLVLKIAGARIIEKKDAPDLYRIAENLSITAGLPMPVLAVIPDPQPNAFATGRDPRHAAVAVTTGLLEMLDRQELEGVVAHEMAHVGNRDILLSTIVVVLVGVIALLADFVFRITFWGRMGGNDREGGQVRLIMFAIGLLFAVLAPVIAQLMKLAISRRREFLADAAGALLTRYPEGLARALEKISSSPHQLRAANDATAHLYIASPFRGKGAKNWIHRLFATHPPAEDRVRALRGMRMEA